MNASKAGTDVFALLAVAQANWHRLEVYGRMHNQDVT
jgi:hypothetical protein